MLVIKQAEDEIRFVIGDEQVRIKILSIGTRNIRLLLDAERTVEFTFLDSPKKLTKAERLAAHLAREAKAAERRAKSGDTRTRAERTKARDKAKREYRTAWKRGISVADLRQIRAKGLPLPPLRLKAKKAIVRHRFVAEDGSTATETGTVKSKRVLERERIAAVKVFTRPAGKAPTTAHKPAKPALVPAHMDRPVKAPKPTPEPLEPKVTTRVLRGVPSTPQAPSPVAPTAPTSRLSAVGLSLPTLPTLAPPVAPEPVNPQPDSTRVTSPGGVIVRRRVK
jgi:hypothetical protein